jgi:hypothetical protein
MKDKNGRKKVENGGLRVFSCNSLTTTTIQKQCKETQRHKTNPTQHNFTNNKSKHNPTQPNTTQIQHYPTQHQHKTTKPNTTQIQTTQPNTIQYNTIQIQHNPNTTQIQEYPIQHNTNPTQPNTNLTQGAKRERSGVIDVKRKFYGNNHHTVHTNTITRRKKLPIELAIKTTLSLSLKNNQNRVQ